MINPVDADACGQLGKLCSDVLVAHELRRAGNQQEHVFDKGVGGAQQVECFFLAVCAAAIGIRCAKEG